MGEQNDDSFIWVGVGVGSLHTTDDCLTDFNAFVNYSKNDRTFKLRGLHAEETDVSGPKPNGELWELGLLYGLRPINGKVSVSFLAGLSYTGGTYRGDLLYSEMLYDYYEELRFDTVGLPLEVHFDVNTLHFVGFSIIFYADINPEKTYGGVNLSILLGYLPYL